MDKSSAYQYIKAMSKAAAFALRIKRANEVAQDKKPTLSKEDFKNMEYLYVHFYGYPMMQELAIDEYRRLMKARDAKSLPPVGSDPSVND